MELCASVVNVERTTSCLHWHATVKTHTKVKTQGFSIGLNYYLGGGFALSGNKTRKFEYLVGDAIKNGYDTIIGIGANQSNFCRILSVVGAKFGLEVHLILSGKKPNKPTGNLLIGHMMNANIYHIDTTESKIRMEKAEEVRDKLIGQGKKVYFFNKGSTPHR